MHPNLFVRQMAQDQMGPTSLGELFDSLDVVALWVQMHMVVKDREGHVISE
jgi:hypothetical protein